jgi:hypothetical protein
MAAARQLLDAHDEATRVVVTDKDGADLLRQFVQYLHLQRAV